MSARSNGASLLNPGNGAVVRDPLIALADPDTEREYLASLYRQAEQGRFDADVTPEELASPPAAAVLAAMRTAVERDGVPLSPAAVRHHLDLSDDAVRHLWESLPNAPWIARPEVYAAKIRKLHSARQLVRTMDDARALIFCGEVDGALSLLRDLPSVVAPRSFEYLDLAAVARDGIPPVDWILPGWLAVRDVALLSGGAGIGKSTLTSHMSMSLAHGTSWCGIVPPRPARVLLVDEEQDRSTCARMLLRAGKPHERLAVIVGQGVRLDHPEGVRILEAAIEDHRPEVVVMDSVQQTFGATDENSATQVGLRFQTLFDLRRRFGTAFVLIHHHRKPQPGGSSRPLNMVRGSTAFGTQVDTVWSARRTNGGMELIQDKRRDAPLAALLVSYEERQDGSVELSGAPLATGLERSLLVQWIVEFLRDHGVSTTSDITAAGERAGHARRSVERALQRGVSERRIARAGRGRYEVTPDQDDS